MKVSVNREDRFIYNVVGTLQGFVEPGDLNYQNASTFTGCVKTSIQLITSIYIVIYFEKAKLFENYFPSISTIQ